MNASLQRSPILITAAQIAIALTVSKQTIHKSLQGCIPSGSVDKDGKPVAAWAVADLPSAVVADLDRVARLRGFRSVENYLGSPQPRFEPAVPFKSAPETYQKKAYQLREALAGTLKGIDAGATIRDRMESDLQEFRRVFGYEISAKQWQRLVERTLDRDNGAKDWQRLDIYLDERIKARQPLTAAQRDLHAPVELAITKLTDRSGPTTDDRAFLFHQAFSHYEELLARSEERSTQRAAKQSLIEYLFSALPALSKSQGALRRVFEMQYCRWKDGGRKASVLIDQRSIKSGRKRPNFGDDLKVLTTLAVEHGGNESMAYRLARRDGLLSPEHVERHPYDERINKSHVPTSIRNDLTPVVDAMLPIHRGPHADAMSGPKIQRDPSDCQPGDYFSADDVTFNVVFWYRDPSGKVHVARGECLVWVDFRTNYPLAFQLITGHYNMQSIRTSFLRVHDNHGLPHKGLIIENAIWGGSLIDGTTKDILPWSETENGLNEPGIGISIRHTKPRNPQSKLCEGMFNILQQRHRSQPGFVGFYERTVRMERAQEIIAKVRNGKLDPVRNLLSMEQWVTRLSRSFEEFASSVQNGKYLNGISPKEAWIASLQRRPLRKLPENLRYLLSTHKKPVKVHRHGIVLHIGGQEHHYFNDDAGRYIGKRILAYYSVEHPELLTCSDLKRQHFFTVRRVVAPSVTATNEQLREAYSAKNGHLKFVRNLYDEIRHDFVANIIRDDQASEAVQAGGEFHNREVEQFKIEKTEQARQLRKLARVSRRTGIAIPAKNIRHPEHVAEAMEDEQQAWARIEAKQKDSAGSAGLEATI